MAERNTSDDQAAFGVFPQLKRNRSKQDREAAKNVPVDLARGALAGVLGAPGDIESLVRMLPYLDEKTVLPTSEDIEKRIPLRSDTPVSKAATGLGILGGGFYTGRGSPLRVVGAIPAAVRHGAEEFAKASVAGVPHVVKPVGGNWLNRTVEDELLPLRQKVGYSLDPAAQFRKLSEKYTPEALERLDPESRAHVQRTLRETANAAAMNKWIDSNLSNYIKKQMATPEDPVRKLAEEGISHFPIAEDPRFWNRMGESARGQYEGTQMAKSDLAKQWENRSDPMIGYDTAQQHQDMMHLAPGMYEKSDEWIKKLPPETPLYKTQGAGTRFNPSDLGFDHIIDVLKQDVAEGRIRPEQLSKVSMEQAVRRTYEYDQEMARKMREAAIKQTEGFPLHKEYPEGYRWIELAKPKITLDMPLPEGFRWLEPKGGYERLEGPSILDPQRTRTYLGETKEDALKVAEDRSTLGSDQVKMLEDALKYEGETMGHCVGGYCPDVLEGKSRIFSLRDAKGEPHVTIETQPSKYALRWDVVKEYMPAAEQEAKNLPNGYTDKDVSDIAMRMAKENEPEHIIQIKGKQNAKPKEDYLPYVQDFVRGGKWGDIGDLKNTGLIDINKSAIPWPEGTQAEQIDRLLGGMQDGTKTPLYKSNQEFFKKAQEELGSRYISEQEYKDWLAKQIKPDVPPAEGMKRGGKVSISKNPDTMMLEVNNQKMAKGGKVVKFIEDVAPSAMDKLAMVFGNKLPLNMNTAEVENLAKRFPEPVVDRVNMAHKDVLKRTPELQEAAARIEAGDMSADEYARLVQRYKPVTPYESVPAPATREEILAALAKTSREAEGLPRKETYFGKPSATLKEGDPVGLRLDIPSYNQANTWVVTAHGPRKSPVSGGAGTRIGYEPVAMATDVDFSVSPKAALGIAKGAEKNTIATMEGKWKPTSSDEAFTMAKQYLKNPEWRQVGMDPERHSFFYDRETMAPVVNAEEVIQIGPLVLAKNPKYGKLEDFKYASGGLAHMKEGGSEDDADLTKPFFGGAGTRKYAAAKKRAEQADVNLLKDPKTYAAVAGLLGEAPDEMGFSVLHPDYQGIKDVAEPAFYAGTALGVAPVAKAFKAPAMALGKAGEQFAEKVVPQIMERGGLGADILGGLAQGTRSNVYLPHTPKNPDPTVGTRYKRTDIGGLVPRKDLDIEKLNKSSVKVFPWDASDRNKLVTEVSDVPLTSPVLLEGGDSYMLDAEHVKKGIAGASNEGIAKRIQSRIDQSSVENQILGGTGRVFGFPIRMGEKAEHAATFPTDIAMDLLKQGNLSRKELDDLTNELRGMSFEAKGKGYFQNVAPIDSPEFLIQLREGIKGNKEKGISPVTDMNLRKAVMDRLSQVKYQKRLEYNYPDLIASVIADELKGVPKGWVGNVSAELAPFSKIRPSKSSTYSHDFGGEYYASMPNMPVEFLMPNTYEGIYLEMKSLYPNAKPEALRNMTIGAMEKRKDKISEMIGPRAIDAVKLYQEGLKQGEFNPNDIKQIYDYMKRKKFQLKLEDVKKAEGGAVTGDDLIIEERPL